MNNYIDSSALTLVNHYHDTTTPTVLHNLTIVHHTYNAVPNLLDFIYHAIMSYHCIKNRFDMNYSLIQSGRRIECVIYNRIGPALRHCFFVFQVYTARVLGLDWFYQLYLYYLYEVQLYTPHNENVCNAYLWKLAQPIDIDLF